MRVEGDMAIFSTGREVYANNGIIGIDPDLWVHQGYDGGFDCWAAWDDDKNVLTKAERKELAEYMIALWRQFGEAEAPNQE